MTSQQPGIKPALCTDVTVKASLKPTAPSQAVEAEGPDGGWGWVMVVALFIHNSLVFGVLRGLGIFFIEFEHYFDASTQSVSWISATAIAFQHFISLPASALAKAYDPRIVVMTGGFLAGFGFILASQATCFVHLFISVGVVSGFGWGLTFSPLLGIVLASFTRRRNLAVGVAMMSIGLASLVLNPFFQLLVEIYTWRGALLIIGAMCLNVVPCGALVRRPVNMNGPEKEDAKDVSFTILLRRVLSNLEITLFLTRPYLTFALASILITVGYYVPLLHLVPHLQHSGFTDFQAAFAMSAVCGGDVVGRLVSGWFSDLKRFRLIHLFFFWGVLYGGLMVGFPLTAIFGSYPAVIGLSIVYGFTAAAADSLLLVCVSHIVSEKQILGAVGLLECMVGIGGLLGSPIAGLLKDSTEDYTVSFIVSGAFTHLGILTITTLPHFFSCSDPTPMKELANEDDGEDLHTVKDEYKH
ncbi:monocarboxylate transporter 13-like [Synchiropus picturatus]